MNAPILARTAGASLAERVLGCFGGGGYALSALLRLLDIVETDTVETAAVECRAEPRLLINPAFIDRHAETPEKLFMLVMHELHHVLLGHTTLFPTATPTQNFIFDAAINGLLCRMFPAPEYTSLFTGYYSAKTFPMCLLRPPPGWPKRPATAPGIVALPVAHRDRAADIHRALYSEAGASYLEVAEILPEVLAICDDGDLTGGAALLGDHGEGSSTTGGLERRAPVLFDVVRSIVEQWPQPPDPIRGRSLADVVSTSRIAVRKPPTTRAILRRLIEKVAASGVYGNARRKSSDLMTIQTSLPGFDRRALVQRALGQPPLLYQVAKPWPRIRQSAERVHIYLDVSGSMDAIKAALYGAILDCREHVDGRIHLFSTVVEDITFAELRNGVCKSTGGTDIACVASHIATHGVRRALIMTDGWVGRPRGEHRDILSRTRLAVALLGSMAAECDLDGVADHMSQIEIGDQ